MLYKQQQEENWVVSEVIQSTTNDRKLKLILRLKEKERTQPEDDKWKPKRKAENTQKCYFKEVFNQIHKSNAH